MPKRKLITLPASTSGFRSLQLYHAKAETLFRELQSASNRVRCNFTMPKRKRCPRFPAWLVVFVLQLYHAKAETCLLLLFLVLSWLQLYHAKAETLHVITCLFTVHQVATLPCQSGNRHRHSHQTRRTRRCNFTMPKRKHRTFTMSVFPFCPVATLPCQSGNV